MRPEAGAWVAAYRQRPREGAWQATELYRGPGQAGQEYAFGVAEAWLGQRKDLLRFAERIAPWRLSGEPATQAQVRALRHLGVGEHEAERFTKEQASARITELSAVREAEPATGRQVWKLRQLGVFVPPGLTKREAGRLIGQALRRA